MMSEEHRPVGRPKKDPVVIAEMLALYRSGLTQAEIGARYGRTAQNVSYHLRRVRGYKRNSSIRTNIPKREQLREWLAAGEDRSNREFGRLLGVQDQTIRRWRAELGAPTSACKGGPPINPNSQRARIVGLLEKGLTVQEIAAAVGTTEATVYTVRWREQRKKEGKPWR